MPIALRSDFDARMVRAVARRSKDGPQARRLLALAAIYEGASRTEAAKVGGVTLQIVRDWVLKFNAQGPEGLIDRKPPGQPSRLNGAHRVALAAIIENIGARLRRSCRCTQRPRSRPTNNPHRLPRISPRLHSIRLQ